MLLTIDTGEIPVFTGDTKIYNRNRFSEMTR